MTIPVARFIGGEWHWRGQEFRRLRSKRMAEARRMIAEYARDPLDLVRARYVPALAAIEAEAAARAAEAMARGMA